MFVRNDQPRNDIFANNKKCHTTRHQTVFFKGWEFFVLTSMRWYVESLSVEKKESRRHGGGGGAAVGATAAFLQARESSSLFYNSSRLQRREAARPNQPGQAHSLNSLGTMQLKEKEMANYVEGSMQYSVGGGPQQAKRKAKPATNPDVHQTRQDCNCVLAIRMQHTMYYYVVVMLPNGHDGRNSALKKNAVGKLQATTSCLSFL